MSLCRTPDGAQLFFWCAPWSVAFWTLVYSQLSASEFWLGAEHVRRWREAHGGLLHTSMWATAWMFFGLIFSYGAEFALIFLDRSPGSGRELLPLFAYSPVFICWCWRRIHLRREGVNIGNV